MNTKRGRFFTFIMKEEVRNFFAFVYYILIVVWTIEINLPLVLEIICLIAFTFISLLSGTVYLSQWLDKILECDRKKIGKNIIQRIKKIGKEILKFIPILIISKCISSLMMVGQPANQTNIEQTFLEELILNSIMAIIVGPIIEEFIFRFLPSRFIKNKILYVIVSTVVFAAMHVLDDPNPFYYIWFYIIRACYYGYIYYKTKDILVPISIHSFNNFIETLMIVFL